MDFGFLSGAAKRRVRTRFYRTTTALSVFGMERSRLRKKRMEGLRELLGAADDKADKAQEAPVSRAAVRVQAVWFAAWPVSFKSATARAERASACGWRWCRW